jgi:phage regulator Rha-like protein
MDILTDLRFVQVQANTAYIDTRVYCAEIIEVEHAPWMRDTLRQYQTVIEEFFGVVEFKTQQPLEGSKGGRPEIYALLTEDQCGFALTLSRNTAKTMRQKAKLIAEFSLAKAALRTQLEAQFTAPSHTAPTFTYPVAQLKAIANYCTFAYTKAAIRRDYVEGLHFVMVGREMMLSEICFGLAVNASRSRAGVDLENCPDIQISIRDAIAHHNAKAANKQNARLTRQSKCPGQLSLQLA